MIIPSDLQSLAERYNVNYEKPYFPLNTMRLFYLMLTRDLTGNVQVAVEVTNAIIPKISGYLDAMNSYLRTHDVNDKKRLDEALSPQRKALYELIATPGLRTQLEIVWEQQQLPIQDQLLREFDRGSRESPSVLLPRLLNLRSADSFIYAQFVGAIIREHRSVIQHDTFNPFLDTQTAINNTVKLMIQINDLADAICYAHDDLRANSAVLISLVNDRTASAAETLDVLSDRLQRLQEEIQHLPLSEPTLAHVNEYAALLQHVLRDG